MQHFFFSEHARIQFRYPHGGSKTKIFPAEATLQQIYDFANDEVASTFGRDNFSLSTTYPARQLDKVKLRSFLLLMSCVKNSFRVLSYERKSENF